MITEILNLPNDIERKVLRFGLIKNDPSFRYDLILKNGIPEFEDLIHYEGFFVRPIEDDTSINSSGKKTESGSYTDNNFDFTIKFENQTDLKSLDLYRNQKMIMFVETTLYRYMIGNFEEPLSYIYKDTTSKAIVTVTGDTRKLPIRQKA